MTEKDIVQKFHTEYSTPKDENYAIEYDAYMAGAKAVLSGLPTEEDIKYLVANIISSNNWKTIHLGHSVKILDVQFITETMVIKLAKAITNLLKGER